MDIDVDQETNVSVIVTVGGSQADSDKVELTEGISSNGEVIRELGSAGEVLSRAELDIACSSEKLVNLNILMLHVTSRENDFEAFASDRENILDDSTEKALEFDLLSGILDSEVKELDEFMATLEADITSARELISLYRQMGNTSMEMEEKLLDSENSLKQLQQQISEIKAQSAKFQRILSALDAKGHWNGDKGTDFSEDVPLLYANAKIKMQTAEQQRHILRMLEKSLAREMDLEKKLAESREIDEVLKIRLLSFEQEVFDLEEETCERLFEAENAAEVLMGISKELLGRLQIIQFNLNGSAQRENELRLKLKVAMEEKENALQKLETRLKEADKSDLADSENLTLRQKVDSLEKQLKEASLEQHSALCSEIVELGKVIEDLKEKLSKAEARAETAEAKCTLLAETNMGLNEKLDLLKGRQEKVNSLERQLRESDIQLQHAVASAEASQEKQSMLYSTIRDMENLIGDLKLKVSKADSRADNAEEKLIILSEANVGLTEELSFLRDRLECLEASLHQVEETKLATAKDIGIRTKVITNLVMQLAIERERLYQQISSLTMEKKVMAVKLQQTKKDPSILKHDLTTDPCTRERKEEVTLLSGPVSEQDRTQENASVSKTEDQSVDLTSELGTVRRIDARLLNYKHVFMALLIVLVPVAAYFFKNRTGSFDVGA